MDINIYEMRSLSADELEQVNGGVLPAVGFALALASHIGVGTTTTGLVGHFATGLGLGIATYTMMGHYGGGGGGGKSSSKFSSH
ncbi:hypothetical protein [Parahaliea mediterranea]|uniref:hypothetical protein n=1 Tax=Parahaliea mediterranea TaxID=651086 RepID=UPI001300312A|nr:hypothetical protein [Parahaliea mediterranea]